ncbi:MAG TPA: acetyl-CoA hydrolase/transferase C-terminal domain-containing protein [Candidatus Binataceae bacterium]|nr:acetyl-CoA hydrolase/transferase C-terminal domain-containing protein [Candidatus Binataceae bacterium]
MPQEVSLAELDLAAIIRPGERVVWGQGAGDPISLVEKLLEQRQRLAPLEIFCAGVRSRRLVTAEHADTLSFTSFGAMGNLGGLARAGKLRVMPTHLSQVNGYFAAGTLRADVVLVHLSAPDGDGAYSYGLANDFQHAAIQQARVVIAEVNDRLPWTYCDRRIDPARIDYLVRVSRPLPQVRPQAVGPIEERIARHVADFISDGATLQIGVGAIPDAVMALIGDRRELGFHSGLINDRVAELMARGVITNSRKPIDTGITTAALLVGTDYLYQFAHKNPAIRLFTYDHTHRGEILSQLGNYITINSAVEVDLSGQINAETASGEYIGGVGGQGDYVRGAQLAGGRSIIALPATARDATISRIVPRLADGIVTTPRSDADIIVTEFGVAELRGRTIGEGARRLAAISHPHFRAALEEAAADLARRGY